MIIQTGAASFPGVFYLLEAGRLNNPHRQGLADSIIMQFKTKEQNRTFYLVKFFKQNDSNNL